MNDCKTRPLFDDTFRAQFERLLRWRRDVRNFRTDPVDPDLIRRLLGLADLAPSVGLSQPWRFVDVRSERARHAVIASFEQCNAAALTRYEGEDAKSYARLKLEGLREAPVHLAVFSDSETQKGKRLGRMTMPEMLAYSTVTAIHTLWLAARAEGLGLGWVSILDPVEVTEILDVPDHWTLVAYLCIGWPKDENLEPELARKGWESRENNPTLLER